MLIAKIIQTTVVVQVVVQVAPLPLTGHLKMWMPMVMARFLVMKQELSMAQILMVMKYQTLTNDLMKSMSMVVEMLTLLSMQLHKTQTKVAPLKQGTLVDLLTQVEIHAVIHSQVLKQTQITNTTNCLFSL